MKKKHFSNRVEENKNNPNKLWKIIKEISPSNFSRKEDPIELPEATLNSLNEHFANTGKRIQEQIGTENNESYDQGTNSANRPITSSIDRIEETTVDTITGIIKNINANKATGIDGIPVKVIKKAIHVLARPITILTNTIIRTGKFPKEFKTAIVTPAFKKGDKNNMDNYRPLSILPTISKMSEYVIKNQLQIS